MSDEKPSHAERCRSLTSDARSGALATIARDPEGHPFASLVSVAFDAEGRPVLLLSTLAEHTQNLLADARASLLVTSPLDTSGDPLAASRVTILGLCKRVPDDERASAQALYLADHPSASSYVEFKDFAFYRLEPSALRYVGGFGRMSWVGPKDYRVAR